MGTLKYRQAHRKELVEKAKIYTQTHKEAVEKYQAEYRQKNKDKTKEYNKTYRATHKEEHNKANQEWLKNHPEYKEQRKELRKLWNKTTKGKLNQHRKNTRRKSYRRKYGATLINQPFQNSVGHHLNKTSVIYIPEKIHLSIKHNLKTGLNMASINLLALDWLHMQKSAKQCKNSNQNTLQLYCHTL